MRQLFFVGTLLFPVFLNAMRPSSLPVFWVRTKNCQEVIPVECALLEHLPYFKDLVETPLKTAKGLTNKDPICLPIDKKIFNEFLSLLYACELNDNSFIASNCIAYKKLKKRSAERVIDILRCAIYLQTDIMTDIISLDVADRLQRVPSKGDFLNKLSSPPQSLISYQRPRYFISTHAIAQEVFSANNKMDFFRKVSPLLIKKNESLMVSDKELWHIRRAYEGSVFARNKTFFNGEGKFSLSPSGNWLLIFNKNRIAPIMVHDYLSLDLNSKQESIKLHGIAVDSKKEKEGIFDAMQWCIDDRGTCFGKASQYLYMISRKVYCSRFPFSYPPAQLVGCVGSGDHLLFKSKNCFYCYTLPSKDSVDKWLKMKHMSIDQLKIVGSLALSISSDKVRLWNVGKGNKPLITISHPKVCCADLNEVNGYIALIDNEGVINLYDSRSGSYLAGQHIAKKYGNFLQMSFAPEGDKLCIVCQKALVWLDVQHVKDNSSEKVNS